MDDSMHPHRVPCISLWQPWASLLLSGVKVHETRSWRAPEHLLGQRFAIHAAKRPIERGTEDELGALCFGHFGQRWIDELPRGALIGTAVLGGCWPTSIRGHLVICVPGPQTPETEADRICGDWGIGRWAWRFSDHQRFERPILVRGRQRIWYEPASLFTAPA